jgi:hypothetical protein
MVAGTNAGPFTRPFKVLFVLGALGSPFRLIDDVLRGRTIFQARGPQDQALAAISAARVPVLRTGNRSWLLPEGL